MTRKHTILMLFMCLIPILGISALAFFEVQVNTLVWVGLLALCPLSHILMMRSSHADSDHTLSQETHATLEE